MAHNGPFKVVMVLHHFVCWIIRVLQIDQPNKARLWGTIPDLFSGSASRAIPF
jgi:hypothetical protein